jgi:putative transposase
MIHASGMEPVVLPPRRPNPNAYCERFVRSIKNEALTRMIVIGEASLRYVIQSYLTHYRYELTHQRLNNQLIAPELGLKNQCRRIVRRDRLGGLPGYYY